MISKDAELRQQKIEALVGLTAARFLLTDKENWAQNYYAYDKKGNLVPPESHEACKWCSAGAVSAVVQGDSAYYAANCLTEATKQMGCSATVIYNDNPKRKHKEILELFDKAIEIAAKEID